MALPAAMVLSGIPQEQFTGNLQVLFNHGTVLLKSPSTSSITSTGSTSSSSSSSLRSSPSESGFSSLSTETERSLDYYLDVIAKLEQRFQILFEFPINTFSSSNSRIMYQNRNVLDLADNLKSDWLFQHAVLQNGVNHFFENRSQLSRLDGAEPPPHVMVSCEDTDCSFNQPFYF